MYLWVIGGREEGAPPPVDLAAERRNGDVVRDLITEGLVTAVHDLSDGGLAIALAEMAMAGGIGASLDVQSELPDHAFLFGEDQARYLVTATSENARAALGAAARAGAPARVIGRTGGSELILPGAPPISITRLSAAHEAWLPVFMAGGASPSNPET
jgi:phosphoribosylformylglycinamidine synthase